jgi:hypothetical protein
MVDFVLSQNFPCQSPLEYGKLLYVHSCTATNGAIVLKKPPLSPEEIVRAYSSCNTSDLSVSVYPACSYGG